MSKIAPEHLARQAVVYIRQSTADQVASNLESKRRQYGLADRARQLGWSDVAIIDDDLGRSGSGVARPGFEKLLAAICDGRVGAVVSIEASRLARNGRDWHTLPEFCGLVGTLIAIGNNSIAKDPDRRIAEAITLVFAKFTEMQSVRQVHLWRRHERIPLPAVAYGTEGRRIEWKLPVYNTLLHILTNPIYAGAYAFGRTGSRVSIEAGRKKVVRGFKKERDDWEVLIPSHHEGYLSWADYERNLSLIADNANGKNPMSRGALRRGEALLAGLLRCGHCGRKLHVAYSGKDGNTGRYHCQGGFINHGGDRCISFGGMRIDREVGIEVIEQPLGIEAALAAQAVRSRASEDKRRHLELALEQARYEVGHARRQYDAVDPDNRLVAAELEKRWNERLAIVRDLETELKGLTASPATELTPAYRERLMTLGADLQLAWTRPGVTPEARKRIVRTLIDEIIVHVEDNALNLVIRWHGGDHSALKVRKNRSGQHRWSAAGETIDLVRVLARQMPDKAIASVLNRAGKTTGRGNGWTQSRVCSLRSHNAIATYREGERRERGEVTLDEAAAVLSVSPSTVRRLIKDGQLAASQLCKGAPWIIKAADLERADVKSAATARRLRRPPSGDPLQKVLEL